jgi:hypothetical protein
VKKVLIIVVPTVVLLITATFIYLFGDNQDKGVREAKYYLNGDVTQGYIEVIDSSNIKFGNFTSHEIANKIVSYHWRDLDFSEEDLNEIGERYLTKIEYNYTDNKLLIQIIESFGQWTELIYYPEENTISFMNQDYIAID